MNKPYLIVCASCIAGTIQAQSIAPAAYNVTGGQHQIGAVTYEWSVGEMPLVSTETQPGITVTQGLLQPATLTGTGIKETIAEGLLQIFPNPATGIVFIQPQLNYKGKLAWVLADATGKIIRNNEVYLTQGNERQEINIAALADGPYFLTITLPGAQAYRSRTWVITKTK